MHGCLNPNSLYFHNKQLKILITFMLSKKYSNLIFKYGIGSGIIMALVLLMFQWFGYPDQILIKYANYVGLIFFIGIFMEQLKKMMREGSDLFIQGIKAGARISFIAGLVVIGFNIIFYLINPELAFNKFFIEPNSILNLLTVSAFLFLEIFVFGSLISFIILQFKKKKYVN